MEHQRAGMMVNRDLKTEIKKMKDTLRTSAQNAFGNDVWERCGIESTHIKKQQLAQLIHGGLGGLFKKKDQDASALDQDAQDGNGAGPNSPNSKRRSMRRTSTATSLQSGDGTQSTLAPDARRSQRKSLLKGGAHAKRRSTNL